MLLGDRVCLCALGARFGKIVFWRFACVCWGFWGFCVFCGGFVVVFWHVFLRLVFVCDSLAACKATTTSAIGVTMFFQYGKIYTLGEAETALRQVREQIEHLAVFMFQNGIGVECDATASVSDYVEDIFGGLVRLGWLLEAENANA